MSQGSTQSFSFRVDFGGAEFNAIIWIDWNDDLDFDDAGETVYTGTTESGGIVRTVNGTFEVPANAAYGNHRMRLGCAYFTTPTPCLRGEYASFEDYTVNVTAPCSSPTGVTATATPDTRANLSWFAPATSTPTGYEYAVTTSATPPANGSSVTDTSVSGYALSASVTYYLHVRAVCSGSNSAWVTSAPFTGVASGDTCATALDLDTLTSPYTSTTVGAADNFYYPECDGETGAPDQVYYIAVPNNITLTISQTNNYDSLHRVAYGGSCPGTTLIACVDIEETTPIVWTNTTGAGRTVYWVQDGHNGGGSYTLSWTLTNACATAAPTASAQTLPFGSTVAALTATGTALQWYSVATGGTALASTTVLATGTYYVSQTLNGCEGPRTAVSVTVSTETPLPTASAQTLCSGATVANLVATGTALQWYTAQTDGSPLASSTVLTTGNYYVSQTLNGTESQRIPVLVSINTTTAPTATSQTFCNGATVANLTATGTALKWYTTATGGTQLTTTATLSTGTYYVSQTLNSCEGSRASVAVTINTTMAPTASEQTFCAGATIAQLTATGTALTWYADATGGTALAATSSLATGTYYASQTLNTCESVRSAVSVTINVTTAPTASEQTFFPGATVAELTATGTALTWYADANGGTALASTATLATGTYYVSQTLNACESVRTAVSVIVNATPAPTGAAIQEISVAANEEATIASINVTGTNVMWYATEEEALNGGIPLDANTILVTGTTYYATQMLNGSTSFTVLAVTVTVTLNIKGLVKDTFSYFPNPVVDYLNIESSSTITNIEVYDLNGKFIFTTNWNASKGKLNMTLLQAATYIVKVTTDDSVKKMVIVKE